MKTTCYLILSKRSGVTGVRKSKPHLQPGEITVRVLFEIPDAMFDPPVQAVSLTLQEGDAFTVTGNVLPPTPERDTSDA